MIKQDDLHFRMPMQKIEYTQRPDQKWNVWCFRQNLLEDTLHRWCLIAVVRNPNRETHSKIRRQ